MDSKKYTQPFTFKSGVTLKNRFIMAPMTTKMSFYDGVITEDEKRYYHMRSKEAGAVITAAANVSEGGKGWEGELGIYDDKHLQGLSSLASAIQINGTKAIVQLYHGGRMTSSSVLRGTQPVAPSAVKAERPTAEEPRPLEEKELFQIIEDFKQGAVRAIKSGFDGIELHGANTYLLQQFFSPHSNRREDKWGGSVEKRFTFIDLLVDEVIQTVKKTTDRPFIIGYRFSPEEYETPGIRFQDSLYLVDKLSDKALDYLHVSLGNYKQVSQSEAYQERPMIAYLNEKIDGRTAFMSVGDIRTGEDAQEALSNSDLTALGRVILADPHWVGKVLNDKEETIRYTVSQEEREELGLTNGVWQFMQNMMTDRLN
ncbi:2,4-dienoyl-CoA reductase-like NADH-dependent reductase (Old Yellow Enzyme family) [Alkalibacterium olivapovliticus]|uniref:2,4-dienoyl-CoA reductase-like NADH-dependent reductase (Old Yellow Enzyme family) n=1 Tax=Alkalibacterium olivapovliticus TaxID=99907 RepID=A0A2T0W733_9LACT|nr:NADH-dependent flavin oxidoreductase [Alkalibacterium olivapovliticus]PRY82515.1 2,4-dienoyl-CoA reductase-like NADH-dependent reductase (Old Yellow Enzyme family) [Alkalibacterium olivapovliticus]